MKKQLLLLLLVTFNFSFSQNYTFSKSTSTYTNLTGATSVNNGSVWQAFNASVNLGFVFNFNNLNSFNFLRFSTNFDESVVFNTHTDNNFAYIFAPVISFLVDRGYGTPTSQSNISYKTEGVAGNRIFKLEWNNAGFYDEIIADNISSDYINFQLWLYEGSNIIEYRYGPSNISYPVQSYDGNVGIGIGLFPKADYVNGNIIDNSYILSGDPNNPTLNYNTTPNYIAGVPESGTVYRFTPNTLAVNDLKSVKNFEIYPTVTKDFIYIKARNNDKILETIIYDNQGRLVKSYSSQEKLDVQNYSSGVYNIVIKTNHSSEAYKFIKK